MLFFKAESKRSNYKRIDLVKLILKFFYFPPQLIQFPLQCMNHGDIMRTFSHNRRGCYIIPKYLIDFKLGSPGRVERNQLSYMSTATIAIIIFLSLKNFEKYSCNKREHASSLVILSKRRTSFKTYDKLTVACAYHGPGIILERFSSSQVIFVTIPP